MKKLVILAALMLPTLGFSEGCSHLYGNRNSNCEYQNELYEQQRTKDETIREIHNQNLAQQRLKDWRKQNDWRR